jgi:hypothetical protein
MKISEIDKLQVGDQFSYKGCPATVTEKRKRDDRLSVGNETEDKSVHLAFDVHMFDGVKSETMKVALTSRLDSKMVVDGLMFELDLPYYQPDQLIEA